MSEGRVYYYLRSGFLHRVEKVEQDKAIELSKDENERLKDKITQNPADKWNTLREAWDFFGKAVGKKPIDFKPYLDKKCAEKREDCARRGI